MANVQDPDTSDLTNFRLTASSHIGPKQLALFMLAGHPFDIFDDLLARAFACSTCLSHLPLLSGYDEPRTLSYQITLFGPISADVRQINVGLRPSINRLNGFAKKLAVQCS